MWFKPYFWGKVMENLSSFLSDFTADYTWFFYVQMTNEGEVLALFPQWSWSGLVSLGQNNFPGTLPWWLPIYLARKTKALSTLSWVQKCNQSLWISYFNAKAFIYETMCHCFILFLILFIYLLLESLSFFHLYGYTSLFQFSLVIMS